MNRPFDNMTAAQFLAHHTAAVMADGAASKTDRLNIMAMAEAVAAGRGFAATCVQWPARQRLAFVAADRETLDAQMRATEWARVEMEERGHTLAEAMHAHGFHAYDWTTTRDANPPAPAYSVQAGRVIARNGHPVAMVSRLAIGVGVPAEPTRHDYAPGSPMAADVFAREIAAALNLARAVIVRTDEGDSFPLGALFDEDDGLDGDEPAEIMATLARGEVYRGGGGAAASFTLTAEGVAA